jgi:hypothetical protein
MDTNWGGAIEPQENAENAKLWPQKGARGTKYFPGKAADRGIV